MIGLSSTYCQQWVLFAEVSIMPTITAPYEYESEVVEPQIDAEATHIYPFDPAFPIDVRFLILSGDNAVRMNRHRYFELSFLSAGITTVQIQDRRLTVREGDLVVIGSDLYHNIESADSRSRLTALFFEPELIQATDGTGEEVEYLMPFLVQKSDFPHVIPARTGVPGEVLGLIHRIHNELPAASVRGRLIVKSYLKMTLALLVNHYARYLDRHEEVNRKRADLERLRPLFDHMQKHYDSPIQVEDAAHICAMSSSYFMGFFKRTTGKSFHSYVNQVRIAKAQFLLTATDKPLASITQEVAFCDQSAFGKAFRKLVGVSPLAYRRRRGKGRDVRQVSTLALSAQLQTYDATRCADRTA